MDNIFPVVLLDYKVEITYFEVNTFMTQILIIDKNKNLLVYEFKPESLYLEQKFQTNQVTAAAFNKRHPNCFFYLTEDKKLIVKLLPKYQMVSESQIDLDLEEILIFDKNQILVKRRESTDIRVVPVFLT